jgi:hypothetical protein
MRAFERRSFMRAAAAAFIGHRDREDPVKVLRRAWADDGAQRVLKAAVGPTGTGDYPAAQSKCDAGSAPRPHRTLLCNGKRRSRLRGGGRRISAALLPGRGLVTAVLLGPPPTA